MKTKEASIEQWRLLVTLIDKVKKMKPWEQFEDMEIFALYLPDEEEMVYVSIMGFHKLCYGLSFYIGDEGFTDLSTVAYEIENESLQNYVTMESSFYSVYFDDQDNVSYLQSKVYDQLNIDKSDRPHFTVKERRCFPDDPDAEEVEHYILYVAALIEALEYYLKENLQINFKHFYYLYDVKEKIGVDMDLELEPRTFDPILPNDEQYLHTLSNYECNEEIWEMEYNYSNRGFERKDGRVANLRWVLTASRTSDLMIGCVPLEEDDDENVIVLNNLFQLIEKHGRPKEIQIKNMRLYPLLGPTCETLQISLNLCEQFIIIEEFLNSFEAYTKETPLT